MVSLTLRYALDFEINDSQAFS
nr:unnamed protein product [Callosobruchus chinensis]